MSGNPLLYKELKEEVKSRPLDCPTYQEAAEAIQKGLLANYDEASVSVSQCPDLTKAPVCLASKGISGQPRLLEIGSAQYVIPIPILEKMYDMKDFPKLTNMDLKGGKTALVIGNALAPWPFIDRNAELMPNITIDDCGNVEVQKTTIARNFDEDKKSYKLISLPKEETRLSMFGNLLLSEGQQGTVLEIRCKKRKGDMSFVSCIRKALMDGFPEKAVGLGGVFTVKKGKLKTHIMPDFSKVPLNSNEDVANWLDFYEMDSDFSCLSFVLSNDPGLDVRLEHSHGYNILKGQGGHYYNDTTPDIVEYVGYYTIAEYIYRVDQPKVTPVVGRD